MENIGIKIVGSSVEVISVAKSAIMEILNAKVDNATMQSALDVLKASTGNGYNTISNCNVTMPQSEPYTKGKPKKNK